MKGPKPRHTIFGNLIASSFLRRKLRVAIGSESL